MILCYNGVSILILSIPNSNLGVITMKGCTFFGHRDAPDQLKPKIKDAVLSLIQRGFTQFYVGNQGAFDRMVLGELEMLAVEFPIRYHIVLAYFPKENLTSKPTILPEGIEQVPPRFAIGRRNDWMIEHSAVVIAYVYRNYGGAAQYTQKARRKGKEIINLFDAT